jgi:hypothetical protein
MLRIAARGSREARRHGGTLLTAVVLALASVIWSPGSIQHAAAGVIDAQCAGPFTRTYDPPVTNTPQAVTVTDSASYDTCLVGSTGSGRTVAILTLSCVNLTALPALTETITWQDPAGDTSTIAWSNSAVVGQTVVFTGTVTAGLHAGDTATKVTSGVSYLASVAQCLLGTPVAQTTGVVDSLVLTG